MMEVKIERKKDMQWGPARSDEQEEVRSYKPRVFAEYGKAHVPETFLNPSPYTRYGGLLQKLNNLQFIVDTRRGSKTRCPFAESNPTTTTEFWPTLDFIYSNLRVPVDANLADIS